MEYTEVEKECIKALELYIDIYSKVKALTHGVPTMKLAELIVQARKEQEEQLLSEYKEGKTLMEQISVLKEFVDAGKVSKMNPFLQEKQEHRLPMQYMIVGNGPSASKKYRLLSDWRSFPREYSMAISCSVTKKGTLTAHFVEFEKEDQYRDNLTIEDAMMLPEITALKFSKMSKPTIFQKLSFNQDFVDEIMGTILLSAQTKGAQRLYLRKNDCANSPTGMNTISLTNSNKILWEKTIEESESRKWANHLEDMFASEDTSG